MRQPLVEGWTGPIPYQLLKDGASFDLTGGAVTISVKDKNQAALVLAGTVAITDALVSKVTFNADAADLKNSDSPLFVRFKLVDSLGKVTFFPNFREEIWPIGKP